MFDDRTDNVYSFYNMIHSRTDRLWSATLSSSGEGNRLHDREFDNKRLQFERTRVINSL
jgi:hypothetical protein